MSSKRKKQVKSSGLPQDSGKRPRIPDEANQLDSKLFRWRVSPYYIDYDHEEWGWGRVPITEFFEILINRLQDLEDMTWEDILKRKHCHDMSLDQIVGKAQDRLREVCGDIDTLHQVDVDKLGRLWGFRDRRTLFLIWRDKNHTVCRIRRR